MHIHVLITAVVSTAWLLIVSGEAQGQNSLSLGLGPTFSLEIEEPGVNARVYYNTGPHLCFGPEFSWFSKHEEELGGLTESTSIWDINLNVHYVFHLSHKLGIYPVGGLNFTSETQEFEGLGAVQHSEEHSAFGANLGGGTHLVMGDWSAIMEFQHVFSDLKDDIITLGVLYTIPFGQQENDHSEPHH